MSDPTREGVAAITRDRRIARLIGYVQTADKHTRQPFDLNYVAIPKDSWERIVGVVEQLTEIPEAVDAS